MRCERAGGRQGQQYPFTLRVVEALERDEDGDPITTMVVDWQQGNPAGEAGTQPDPWTEPRRQDQRTAVLRLKRVLMGILADRGVELPIPSNGPIVRMVGQELVREQFYLQTSADGHRSRKGAHAGSSFAGLSNGLRRSNWSASARLMGKPTCGWSVSSRRTPQTRRMGTPSSVAHFGFLLGK